MSGDLSFIYNQFNLADGIDVIFHRAIHYFKKLRLYFITLHCLELNCTVLYSFVSHYIVLYTTVLYFTVLCYVVL